MNEEDERIEDLDEEEEYWDGIDEEGREDKRREEGMRGREY